MVSKDLSEAEVGAIAKKLVRDVACKEAPYLRGETVVGDILQKMADRGINESDARHFIAEAVTDLYNEERIRSYS